MQKTSLPVIIEQDEDGFFVLECPLFKGCYAQGKTLAEAHQNFHEVVDLLLEEPLNKEIYANSSKSSYMFETMVRA